MNYDYFCDRWVLASQITDKIPLKVSDPESYPDKNRNIEIKDTAYCYFLNIKEYLRTGVQEPFDYAKPKIKDMFVNLRQVDFIQKIKNDLYRKALNENKIKHNN